MSKIVSQKDVLEILVGKDGQVSGFRIDGKVLSGPEVSALQSEANIILESRLWQLLADRTCYLARIRGVDNAKDFGDVRDAQGCLRTVASFESILEALRQYGKVGKQ